MIHYSTHVYAISSFVLFDVKNPHKFLTKMRLTIRLILMHREMVVVRSHDEASIFTNYEISREFAEAQALDEGPRFKNP